MSGTDDRFGVSGQAAIVTGASSGIGRAIAERFADDGASVAICSRERGNVEPVAEAIEDDGGRALAVECDVRDRDAVEAFVDAAAGEFGGVDSLVNNAGASFAAPFDAISENGWKTIVDVNLHGTYHCTRAAGEHLREGGGSVINVASVAGRRGAPMMSHYGAAKAGAINLTRSLAVEWASRNVRVNCIAPGYVATPGLESQLGVSADDVDRAEVDRRIGTAEEIADVARFLASPAASFVVGETVVPQGVPPGEELPEG